MRSAHGLIGEAEDGEVVVKKTMRTMVLALAGVLGSVAVAEAQPAPPPAPPAPPPPAYLPPAAPTVSWGAPPPADTTTPAAEPEKKQNPWYFTRFNWGNSAGTKMLGVGGDSLGFDDQQYLMSFALNARYYFLNQSINKAYVNLNTGFEVELTDSNSTTTTTKHEPKWNDTSFGVGYSHTVYRNADKTLSLAPLVSASYVAPTSKEARLQGKYGTTNLNLALVSLLPLVGPKSDWLSDLFAVATVGWGHTFSRATTSTVPSDSYVNTIARQAPDTSLAEYRSDQLSAGMLAHDKVKLNFTYSLTLYKDLSLSNTWEIVMPFKYPAPATDIPIATGPVHLNEGEVSFNPVTTFDVGLSYTFYDMTRIDIGYTNTTPELGDKGTRYSVFYSPNAIFYGNVSVYIDSIIEKATTPPEAKKAAFGLKRGLF